MQLLFNTISFVCFKNNKVAVKSNGSPAVVSTSFTSVMNDFSDETTKQVKANDIKVEENRKNSISSEDIENQKRLPDSKS